MRRSTAAALVTVALATAVLVSPAPTPPAQIGTALFIGERS